MTYEPTPDEKRVIAWLRRHASGDLSGNYRVMDFAKVFADAIEQGHPHDEGEG